MALNWEWSKKAGNVTFEYTNEDGTKYEETYNLYKGNAYIIMIDEFTEDGTEKYNLVSFFADKPHMNACLGLTKGMTNLYKTKYYRIKAITMNRKYCTYWKELTYAFGKAFEEITITIT